MILEGFLIFSPSSKNLSFIMNGSVLPYHKVASSTNASLLEPYPRFYKRFMNGKFDVYAM